MERRKYDSGRYPDRRRPNRSDDDTGITPTIITPTYDSGYSSDPVVDYQTPTTDTPSDWSGGGGGFDGGGASGTW